MNQYNQLTIGQVLGALKRHKWKSAAAFATVMLLVVAMFLLWPRKFGSEGRLFVQLGGRNTASLDPTSGSNSVSIQDSRETGVRSVLEIVKSRAVLEACVDVIGAEEILKSKYDFLTPRIELSGFLGKKADSEDGLSEQEYRRLQQRELAAKKLEQNLSVEVLKKSCVISIFVKADSPRLAQKIVDEIMRLSREKHLDVQSMKNSSNFFDREFAEHERQLVEAVKAQSNFRNANSFLSIEGARNSLQEVISRLENEKIDAEVKLDGATKSVDKYTEEISEIRDIVQVPTSGVEKLSFEDSRTEMFRLETERARAISMYNPDHPEVKRIESQLQRVKASLKAMEGDRTETVATINPVYEKVKVNFVDAIVERDAAQARLASIDNKFQAAKLDLARLNEISVEADQLQRNVDIARDDLALFAKKRGEARVLEDMDKMSISEVVVAQPANFVLKKVSPKGSVMLPLGLFAAIMTAFATALFFDRNHLSSEIGEDEVEQILDLPVLVTLPRVYSSRNMVN
jgi:uncharacterized protein involved in exopolysaccharide biosynthesis